MKKKSILISLSLVIGLMFLLATISFIHTAQAPTCVAWKHATPSYLTHHPEIYEDLILIASPRILYALEKEKGTCQWKQQYQGQITELSPVVNGVCYLILKKTPMEPTSTLFYDTAELLALDARSGELLWSKPIPVSSENLMAYSDGVAISHELFLRIEDGSKRWEKPKLDNPLCIEIEEEHRLICTSYNKVFCFDVRSGEMIWKNQIEDLFVSKVIKEDNQIILGTEKGWIYCIESTYGTIQWKIQVCHTIDCLPMIYNKCLFISGGKTDPSVSCFDMTEGTRLWTYRIDSQGTSSPYVTNGKVYVGAHERKHPWGFSYHDLYCLDANNGELVWKYNTKSLIWSRPVVENNNIYFSSLDKNIYRINENTLIKDNFYKNRK